MAGMKEVYITSLSEASKTDVEGVGTIRIDRYGNVYRWMQNKTGGDLSQYQVGVLHPAASGMTEKVYKAATSYLSYLAGVAQADIPQDYYGWFLVEGYGTAKVKGSVDAGDYLVPVNGQLYLGKDGGDTPPTYPRWARVHETEPGTGVEDLAVEVHCR